MFWISFFFWGIICLIPVLQGRRPLQNHNDSNLQFSAGCGFFSLVIFGLLGLGGSDGGSWLIKTIAGGLAWYGILAIIEHFRRKHDGLADPLIQSRLDKEHLEFQKARQQERLEKQRLISKYLHQSSSGKPETDTSVQPRQTRRVTIKADGVTYGMQHEPLVEIRDAPNPQVAQKDVKQPVASTVSEVLRDAAIKPQIPMKAKQAQYLSSIKSLATQAAADRTKVATPAQEVSPVTPGGGARPGMSAARLRLVGILQRRATAVSHTKALPAAKSPIGKRKLGTGLQSLFGATRTPELTSHVQTQILDAPISTPTLELTKRKEPVKPLPREPELVPALDLQSESRFTYQPKLVESKLGQPGTGQADSKVNDK